MVVSGGEHRMRSAMYVCMYVCMYLLCMYVHYVCMYLYVCVNPGVYFVIHLVHTYVVVFHATSELLYLFIQQNAQFD